MAVPLFDLTRQNEALMPQLLATSERVLRSGQFIMGEEITALEEEVAQSLQESRSLAVSSGTDAILLALMAAGIGPGDEVIVPDFTFFCTAGCVARLGARPVFVDICPYTYNLLPEAVAAAVTDRTRAILPVHLFGQPAEMKEILETARQHDLTVIEDCAQSIGAKYGDAFTGTMGDYGAISFFPTKNLGAFGDGGLLLAANQKDFDRAKIMRVHGMEPKYYHPAIGGNFRMDALQAALLRIKLPHLASYNANRRRNAGFYRQCLTEVEGVWLPNEPLPGEPPEGTRLILPLTLPHNEVTWNQFTVRVPGEGQRKAFRQHLQGRGIGTEIYYPVPLSQQECFADLAGAGSCPNAARVANECVSLPIFPELTDSERQQVVEAVRDWVAA